MKILKAKDVKIYPFVYDCPINILLLVEHTYHLSLYNFPIHGIISCARCVQCVIEHRARRLVNCFILRLAAPKSPFKALQRPKKVQEVKKLSH